LVAFLLLPMIDGNPRYFIIPKTTITPKILVMEF